ncbi:TRAP transporter large permease [Agrococcus baldri]|uniref:TRAP C4-dicarboxylate transport system permease DctM subunit domain-containing protein n=1 Tax=Agrococcus baldri TaxID=153730 RepID=A0AA87UW55_9MICO|nr:TRAP transporter large permease [Agrococcus baldri]GEK79157.1 hypothetical protein ABA31_05080 [Agrococcus baldri]
MEAAFLGLGGMFALLIVLLLAGVRVGIALGAIALLGLWIGFDYPLLDGAGLAFFESINSLSLTAIPLFVLMGELLLRAKFVDDVYRLMTLILQKVPGGAAYANIGSSVIFASMSGSSIANAATMGTVAGPTMVKLGYSKRLTFGSIAAGGTLGILLPPSTVMIMYGGMTGESIGALFMAGILPGIIGAALFCLVIFVGSLIHRRKTGVIPGGAFDSGVVGERSLGQTVVSVVAVLSLIVFILGGIYAGLFSPTESAGVGAGAALLLGLGFRRFNLKQAWAAVGSTVYVSAAVLFIIGAAGMFSYLLKYLGYTADISAWLSTSGLPVWVIVLLVGVFYLVLGLFIESTSLIVMTIPVVYPILSSLGVDGVWLGIIIIILVEIGLITPPVGMNLFVLQRVKAGQTFSDIALGSLPFVGALLALVVLISVFPSIVTWLPGLSG